MPGQPVSRVSSGLGTQYRSRTLVVVGPLLRVVRLREIDGSACVCRARNLVKRWGSDPESFLNTPTCCLDFLEHSAVSGLLRIVYLISLAAGPA